MSKTIKFGLGFIALGICLTSSTPAVDLLDTTGNGGDTNWRVGRSSGIAAINQRSDSLVVSGGDCFLESLTLDLSSLAIASDGAPDDYEIRFWGNDVDKPGNLLESWTVTGSDFLSGDTVVLSSDTVVKSILQPTLSDGSAYPVGLLSLAPEHFI